MTLWSDWTPIISPIADGLISERRTRFVCSIGSSSNHQLPEIKSDTVVYRVCTNQERNDCQEIGILFCDRTVVDYMIMYSLDSLDSFHSDDWSPWSVWSGKYLF